jgi:hypothetical protein
VLEAQKIVSVIASIQTTNNLTLLLHYEEAESNEKRSKGTKGSKGNKGSKDK